MFQSSSLTNRNGLGEWKATEARVATCLAGKVDLLGGISERGSEHRCSLCGPNLFIGGELQDGPSRMVAYEGPWELGYHRLLRWPTPWQTRPHPSGATKRRGRHSETWVKLLCLRQAGSRQTNCERFHWVPLAPKLYGSLRQQKQQPSY